MRPYVVDFETEAITGLPNDPPHPVGAAILAPGKAPYYLAWGHPEGNNTTALRAKAILQDVLRKQVCLFHNAAFDLAVARKWLNVEVPPWERIHDTLFLVFLKDPHARTLSLKPSAERYLGEPPTEQDELREHLLSRGVIRKNQKDWGAFICKGHGEVVGRYAIGDVKRTLALWEHLLPTMEGGLKTAYDRERRLLPILLRNEQEGIRVDYIALENAERKHAAALRKADRFIRRKLAAPRLNVDSNEELAEALKATGVVREFKKTPTGKDSVAKKNLTPDMFTDREVAQVLGYRNRLSTALGTFMQPWLRLAERRGRIHTSWNQVRSTESGGFTGTRTGRLSCSPNFQNIPKTWEGFEQPEGMFPLPLMRRFVLPDEGHVFLHRDYSQQELRVLAHFEDDILCEQYRADPRLDIHTFIANEIRILTGIVLARGQVKILVFGMIYGMGLAKLAQAIGVDIPLAQKVKWALKAAIPGLHSLEQGLKARAHEDLPVRTWGGRLYYCEEPTVSTAVEEVPVAGGWQTVVANPVQRPRIITWEYKMLNYLVQGSSADMTKEALIRYDREKQHGRFLVTVHDEVNVSCPRKYAAKEMEILRKVMEGVEFDVQMLTEGKYGPSWGRLEAV
jgi:DNA polymerase-1